MLDALWPLTGADLFNTTFLETTLGSPDYDALTNFTNAYSEGLASPLFDLVAAGWLLVPEPAPPARRSPLGTLLGLAQRRTNAT